MLKRSLAVLTLVAVLAIVWVVPGHAGGQGTVVIANRADGTISLIDVATNQVIDTILLPGATPQPMYVNYARGKVFVGDRSNNRVVVYDGDDFSFIATVPAGNGVFHQWAAQNGKQLWVVNDIDASATVIDTKDLDVLATVPMPVDLTAQGYRPHDVFQHPNKPLAYVSFVGAEPGYVVQFDRNTFAETGRATVGGDPHLSISKQQDQLFVASQGAGAVYVLDPISLAEIDVIVAPGAHGAWTTKNGKYFYTTNLPGGGNEGLRVIDVKTNSIIDSVDTPYPIAHNIVVAGNKLYVTHSGSTSDKVTVWSVSNNSPVPVPAGEVVVGLNPFGLGFVP